MIERNIKNDRPLVVDLDGSLIHTDLLHESCIRVLFQRPWFLLLIPFWLATRGIAYCKAKVAQYAMIDIEALPYRQALVEWLKAQKVSGRSLILCTGATQSLANKIAESLGLFDDVITSDQKVNLTGNNKAKLLIDRYGEFGFSYVGNESKDLKIWKHANSAVLVGEACNKNIRSKIPASCNIEAEFKNTPLSIKTILKTMRIHQWSKNTLLFIPLLTSHRIFDLQLLYIAIGAFLSFGFIASATYIINDLSDLDSDRLHWKKKFRPLASSNISIKNGLILFSILFILSISIASKLPFEFSLLLTVYIATTLLYSFWFKRLQTVDIVVLASLYTIRIFAGSAAVDVQLSFWLLSFSMFVFLSLAIVKRISEIIKKKSQTPEADKLSGRGYFVSDLPVLTSLGAAAGMVSILVFSLYVNSPEVINLYKSPTILWGICPVIGYWIIRILIMSSRGEIDEDPISFAIKDTRSWIAGIIAALIITLAWALEV